MNEYWIANHGINKKVITKEIQCYLGPEAHARPYSYQGEDGFLIVSPGPCITDVSSVNELNCSRTELTGAVGTDRRPLSKVYRDVGEAGRCEAEV